MRRGRLRAEKGGIEPDLDHADLFTLSEEVFNGLLRNFGARAHEDDDALRIRGAQIVEQFVGAAG